ncbi:histidine phosphatase family protein [Bacillus lacus]|uniref:Histidine phosphatase family protein n=1 Tax=Metabacillus lacus TaxID=1983721 RepID=A0A7X2J3D5_9BACI|nr:histidine phosphatase family protein [Metabacillus lacus]MRX73978.1 histidine phosphatase family protein [Metabacillus lacus]
MTLLLLIRHGETDENKMGKFIGRTDPPLNENGKRQALQIANMLKEAKPDALLTSPLQRAGQTAAILSLHLDIPVTVKDELMERSFGKLEGKRRIAAEKQWGPLTEETLTSLGAEPLDQLQSRVWDALYNIEKNHQNKTVAAVTHGAWIQAAVSRLQPETEHLHIDNGSLIRIQYKHYKWELV